MAFQNSHFYVHSFSLSTYSIQINLLCAINHDYLNRLSERIFGFLSFFLYFYSLPLPLFLPFFPLGLIAPGLKLTI
jgi:hypothetical protein